MKINYNFEKNFTKFCANIDCIILLIDKVYLQQMKFDANIRKIKYFICVYEINDKLYDNFKYVELNFYISKKLLIDNKTAMAHFRKKIYVVNNLRVNVLFDVDIFSLKKIIIDMSRRTIILSICDDLITTLNFITKN